MRDNSHPRIAVDDDDEGYPVIRAVQMDVIHFFDKKQINTDGSTGREIILIYVLGEDGIVREFANGKWTPFPITGAEKVV